MECKSMLFVKITYLTFGAFQILFPTDSLSFSCKVVSSSDMRKNEALRLVLTSA